MGFGRTVKCEEMSAHEEDGELGYQPVSSLPSPLHPEALAGSSHPATGALHDKLINGAVPASDSEEDAPYDWGAALSPPAKTPIN